MAQSDALPTLIRRKLESLERRVRLLRAAQGLCWVGLVLAISAFAVILADSYFTLSTSARVFLLACWLALGIFGIRRQLVRPLAEPLDAVALAGAVEAEFPRLDERLTTTAELSAATEPAHGSPSLIAEVIQEAEVRTARVNFRAAAPAGGTVWGLLAAIAVLAMLLSPLTVVQGAGEKLRRFFTPWRAAPDVPYRVVVSSGNAGVKRGDPVTLAAYLVPTAEGAELPTQAQLAVRNDSGLIEHLAMRTDQDNVFSLRRAAVEGSFDYRVEAGRGASEWFHITAVDTPSVAEAHVRIVSPAYVGAAQPEQQTEGLIEMNALQFSKLIFELRFDRAPAAAWFEWAPSSTEGAKIAPERRIPLQVSEGLEATASMPALTSGTVQLVLEAELGVRNEYPAQPLDVREDAPPRFRRVSGLTEQERDVRPAERLKVACVVTDDVAVARVELEYRVNDKPVERLPLSLRGAETTQVSGEAAIDLAGKVHDGDRFQYRLVAADNRNVPEAELGPQLVFFPTEDRWSLLHVTPAAAPLAEQEILARKKEIDQRLTELVGELKSEQSALAKFKAKTARHPVLLPDYVDWLGEQRGRLRETAGKVAEFARDIALTADLGELAVAVRRVAEQELAAGQAAVAEAEKDEGTEPRNRALDGADAALGKAIERLEALRAENERLAVQRLDRQAISDLGRDQEALAEKAKDPRNAKSVEAEQKELLDRLEKALARSPQLRQALEERHAREAEQLAAQLRDTARQQRGLANAMKDADQVLRQQRIGDLLRRQRELAAEVERFARRTLPAARAAQVPPLDPQAAQQAAGALEGGRLVEALRLQESSALGLDRMAEGLGKAAEQTRDPRAAASQLARLQEELRQRVEDQTRETPLSKLPADQRAAIVSEQELLRDAARQLQLTSDPEVTKARQEAVVQAGLALEALRAAKSEDVDKAMAAASDALDKVAALLPPLGQRLSQAKQEAAALKGQQATIAKQFDREGHLPEKRSELAKREAQVIEKLKRLEAPTLEKRQQRAIQAAETALNDLREGLLADAPASQQAARRELEQLEQALGGQKPADEKLDELIHQEREIAALAEKAATDPAKGAGLLVRQSDIIHDLLGLPLDAPVSQAETVEALRRAEHAISNGAKPEDQALLAREAAAALEKLAALAAGRVKDAEWAERLARKQQAAAESAEKAKQPPSAADLVDIQRELRQLAEEARRPRAGAALQRDKQKALDALQQAQQAAPEKLAKAQRQAADALKQFADKLGHQTAARPEPPAPPRARNELPSRLPSANDAADARTLAAEQRSLRDEAAKAAEELYKPPQLLPENPLGQLQKSQEEIAQKAAEVARGLAERTGVESEQARQAGQAADAAHTAAEQLQNGHAKAALQAGQQTGERLRQVAKSAAADSAGKTAAETAALQDALNQKLAPFAGNQQAARTQQLMHQDGLQRDAGQTARDLNRLAEEMYKLTPDRSGSAEKATQSAHAAEGAMKSALAEGQQGRQEQMTQSQERAAQALERAALEAQSAKGPARPGQEGAAPELGDALEQAMRKMQKAQSALNGGKGADAESQMHDAAGALQDAAQKMASAGDGGAGPAPKGKGKPGANDGTAEGAPTRQEFGPEAAKYAGKAWGELPGELRTRLIQDLKARYGEDYARNIRYYFEQIAERK
jgi:hypothetical protein